MGVILSPFASRVFANNAVLFIIQLVKFKHLAVLHV